MTYRHEAPRVRHALSRLEDLPPVPYVLLFGMTWGVVQALSDVVGAARTPSVVPSRVLWLLTNAVAVVMWWASVRRRRFSVWRAAWHATLAMDLAHLISLALTLSAAHAAGNIPRTFHILSRANAEAVFWAVLGLSPIRFIGAAALLALGRLLPGSGQRVAPPTIGRAAPEAVS